MCKHKHANSWRPNTSESGLMRISWSRNFSSDQSRIGPGWLPNSSCDYWPSSRVHIWSRHMGNWQNPHTISITCALRTYYDRKGQLEINTASFTHQKKKNSKSKAMAHSWRDCRDEKHHEETEGCGVVILNIFPSQWSVWPVRKTGRRWRMIVDYCKLCQGVSSTVAAIPDVALLL